MNKIIGILMLTLLAISEAQASMVLGMIAENRIAKDSSQSASGKMGYGVSFTIPFKEKISLKAEILNSTWTEKGNYMSFENSQTDYRGWGLYTLKTGERFKFYTGGAFGLSQYSTEMKFEKESKSGISAFEPLLGGSLGVEVELTKNLYAVGEGRLLWSRYNDPNTLAAFLINLGYQF